MAARIREYIGPLEGRTLLEVGTGHLPRVPVAFFLLGAQRVITMDLHRRLVPNLLAECLTRIVENTEEVIRLYSDLVDPAVLRERLQIVERLQSAPLEFLEEAGIHYMAPADAAYSQFPDKSVDCHFSLTTLEHISPEVLPAILSEAKRILIPGGLAIHLIDLSDHFQHQDSGISSVNFLRFSPPQWQRIAGNEFAYCNRLRTSEYEYLFCEAGFQLLAAEREIDSEAVELIRQGFPLHQDFADRDPDELAVVESLFVYANSGVL